MNRKKGNGMLRKMTFEEHKKQELKKLKKLYRKALIQGVALGQYSEAVKLQGDTITNLKTEIEKIKSSWYYKLVMFFINLFKFKKA